MQKAHQSTRLERHLARLPWFPFFLLASVLPIQAGSQSVIKVGVYENHPKIYTTPEGQASGFFPAVLDRIAEAEGWQLEYEKGTWQECLDRLARGEINIMPDVALSAERLTKYDFNDETVLISWAVIYSRPDIAIQSFFDLAGRRIAVMKGSIYSAGAASLRSILAQFDIQAEFVEYPSYQEVFGAISRREADAGVVNNIFGSYFEKDYNVTRSAVLFSPSQLRFAFTKNDPVGQRLKPVIDARLREWKQNPLSPYYQAMDTHLYGAPHGLQLAGVTNWESALTAEERDWLARHPVIRLGIDPEFYPFEYRDERGQYQGIASDYVRLFNTRLGLNLRVVDGLAWTAAVAGIKSGQVDVLPCVGITAERAQFLLFSKPYIRYQRVILTRLDMPFLAGLKDIEGLRVGIQAGTSHEGFLKERSSIQPIVYDSLQACLLALSGGKVDAVVANLSSAAYWIRKLNLINLKAAAPAAAELDTLHFAVRQDWPELVAILNKALNLVSTEQQRDIEQRWVAVEYKPGIEPRVAWRFGLRVAAVVLAVLATILVWNYRLKREIRRRREVEHVLNFREHFERLVSETSSRLMALKPGEMDRHIQATLAEMACFTGAAAGFLYVFDKDGGAARTHAGGDLAALAAAGFDTTPRAGVLTGLERLRRGESVVWPAAELATVTVATPFTGENDDRGFIGLLHARQPQPQWREEDISLLRLMGQIFAHALRRQATELAMAQYAADLEKANRQLHELDQLKNMFIASVSHELRTPLNSIIGFTGVILKGMTGALNEKQHDQLTRVYNSAQHLLALITDIIDISKIEAGHVDIYPQPFQLDELLKEAVESLRPQMQAKGLGMVCDWPAGVAVHTDRKRLRQCVLNYLSNAVKYTEHGEVRLTARDLGDEVEIAVSDTGIGIAPEDQQRLFEPFVRLDSHLRIKAGGTGLGLYLTRKILLEILRGTLSVSSEKGRGSTFALRIPKQLPVPAAGGQKGGAGQHETRPGH